jgi:hypothetical protein
VTEVLGSPFHDLSFGAVLANNRDRRGTRALRAYTSERRRYGGKATATVLAIHGIRAKLKYVGALLFPDRAFLASRANEGSAGSYVRRWLIPFRWFNKRLATALDADGRQPKDSIDTGDRR